MNLITTLIVLATLGTIYAFWLRPAFKEQPSLAYFYDQERSLWAAIKLKFGGLKQKLTVAAFTAAGIIVEAYDFIQPLVAQSGVDVTTLTSKVPAQAWPIIGMAILGIVTYFRRLADRRHAAELEAANLKIAALTLAALPVGPVAAVTPIVSTVEPVPPAAVPAAPPAVQ